MIQLIEDLGNYHPKNEYSDFVKNYYRDIIKFWTKKYISNIDVEIQLLEVNWTLVPISIGNNKENCYTTSIIWSLNYASEELKKEKNIMKSYIYRKALKLIKTILFKLWIENNIYIWNFLLSTNILPNLSKEDITELVIYLNNKYKNKCLIFRSVNSKITYDLKIQLENVWFNKIASRQIFFFSKNQIWVIWNMKDNKYDEKLVYKINPQLIDFQTPEFSKEVEQLKGCYDELYISKYTSLNPNFTLEYYKNIITNKYFTIKWILINNEIVAVYWFYSINKISTTPIFWYILDKNKEFGLYRIITNKTIHEALEQNEILNHSSWAWRFKLNRWANFDLEYSYFYSKNLSITGKLWWFILEKISRYIIAPNLQNNIY
jgi:hypothetical protein